jgi:hypothetical protein
VDGNPCGVELVSDCPEMVERHGHTPFGEFFARLGSRGSGLRRNLLSGSRRSAGPYAFPQGSGLDQRREQVAFAQTAFDHGLDHTVEDAIMRQADAAEYVTLEPKLHAVEGGIDFFGQHCGNRRESHSYDVSSRKHRGRPPHVRRSCSTYEASTTLASPSVNTQNRPSMIT